jgi:hypothetical protein
MWMSRTPPRAEIQAVSCKALRTTSAGEALPAFKPAESKTHNNVISYFFVTCLAPIRLLLGSKRTWAAWEAPVNGYGGSLRIGCKMLKKCKMLMPQT